ncbi:MAG: AraC family transcriptional regulator [Saprospiraceae bacterium]|nr:AraC family transcriptional regulator [Saprospiraceae bacterium]
MFFGFSNYSSILLIFFFHGVVYASLLLWRSWQFQHRASRLLAIFILLCCLYICPWMLGHAGWYTKQPYRDTMFYVPFQQVFFLGPVIFFYTQSLVNQSFQFRKKDLWHLVPGLLYLVYSLVVFITDKWIVGEYYFYADQRDKDLSKWYQVVGLISMILYFLASIRYYFTYKTLTYNNLSFAESVQFKWIRNFLIAFLLMQIADLTFLIIYPEWGDFPQKWWYYFLFSLLFYYVSIAGYASTMQAVLPFSLSIIDGSATLLPPPTNSVTADEQPRPSSAPVTPEIDIQPWKNKVEQLIQEEQLYRDPKLSLTDLAQRLDTNSRVISKTINQGFEMNFNDYINFHRVEAVKEAIRQGANKELTLLGIALDCGFNSKTTFNRAFKKHSGASPKAFLQKSSDSIE